MFAVGQISLAQKHLRNVNVGSLGTYELQDKMQMNAALNAKFKFPESESTFYSFQIDIYNIFYIF